jgi:ACS family sodium-dependent inorganic phosphate cotransporter
VSAAAKQLLQTPTDGSVGAAAGNGSAAAVVPPPPAPAAGLVAAPAASDLDDSSNSGSSSSVPPWYYAVGLSAVAALICSVDRAAISVAILPMSEEFGWSDSTKGAINRWAGVGVCRQQDGGGACFGTAGSSSTLAC